MSRQSTPRFASAALATASPLSFGLRGRVVVVTGAAHGIGRACAQRLAGEGARLALWDVDGGALVELQAHLTAGGADTFTCPVDVADPQSVQTALDRSVQHHGRIDGLVSNAGVFHSAAFLDIRLSDWQAVLGVNLTGSFLVGQAVARQMVQQGDGGAIVHMSSVNGTLAIAELASYNASKGGLNQLTRAMALGLADHGIRVNAVAPGTIATELARNAVLTSDAARQRILGRTPMKRLGEPEEVADVVAFLLSDASRYMTGEIVHVDGGRMALNYTVPV